MMAVYASAGVTLAMRSVEPPGERYHQRGWTLQEFCSASSLIIEQQDDSAQVLDIYNRIGSVSDSEDKHIRSLRDWCSDRICDCRPFWLNDSMAEHNLQRAAESYDRYLEISGKVLTKICTDKMRALYPLLTNTPVENQEELVKLITQVTNVLNVNEPQLGMLCHSLSCRQVQQVTDEDFHDIFTDHEEGDKIN
uniref:Heterokaryon incompatibility domain-containing protein n=1 Tax=Tetraselmis sp. GSL018 TaxID=582737 RepID=A0A061SJQ1_9CHLO